MVEPVCGIQHVTKPAECFVVRIISLDGVLQAGLLKPRSDDWLVPLECVM